eukprot:TRINITY_DN9314_c0_g1_i1.p1 TRINITY_DN9314_c0_g1~~TRINITY_DN9314_c0_g1_i1.p1  ORF type:complete len:817 (+),score=152.19 TRINITY_DN9314_c0_g1_i1:177-2453(+)
MIWQKLQKVWATKQYNPNLSSDNDDFSDKDTSSGGDKSKKERLLFAKRPNGEYVQMVCPVCDKSHFAALVGFLNHCRIIHKLKFLTFEDATIHCGRVVDEKLIPEDDPVRQTKSLVHYVHDKKREYMTSSLRKDSISRFYVKKRIITGNVSQRIAPDSFPITQPTHKWMIYVRSPDYDTDNISRYLKKVRFFLHPSFAPSDLVEVHSPPFQITRVGWGEFPIRIQLHFVDPKNKPINIIHQLKLDRETPGLPCLGSETCVDVELDRQFFELGIHTEELASSASRAPVVRRYDQDEESSHEPIYSYRELSDFITHEAKENFPLISAEKQGALPYSCAESFDEWQSWNHGKRKASEWQRARRISIAMKEELGVTRSTYQILTWCVREGLTPFHPQCEGFNSIYMDKLKKENHEKLKNSSRTSLSTKISFCRYCGSVHYPLDEHAALERNCYATKRRKINSYSRIDIDLFMGLPRSQKYISKRNKSVEVMDLTEDDNFYFPNHSPAPVVPIPPRVPTPISLPHINNSPIQMNSNPGDVLNSTPSDLLNCSTPDMLNGSMSSFDILNSPLPVYNIHCSESSYSHTINVPGTVNQTFIPLKNRLDPNSAPHNLDSTSSLGEMSSSEPFIELGKIEWIKNLLKEIDIDVTGNLALSTSLNSLATLFLKSLIEKTYRAYSEEKENEECKEYKVMVPYHVFDACISDPSFDFLTNNGMEKKIEVRNPNMNHGMDHGMNPNMNHSHNHGMNPSNHPSDMLIDHNNHM